MEEVDKTKIMRTNRNRTENKGLEANYNRKIDSPKSETVRSSLCASTVGAVSYPMLLMNYGIMMSLVSLEGIFAFAFSVALL